jgi:general secretion pathway protein I
VRARGFTLVEVMVALAIVAIALPAVMTALYQQVDDTAYLRDKTIAHMVAANRLAEMRLVIGATRNLAAGKDNGIANMLDRDWYWWLETKTTPVPNFFRVEISVALEEEQKDQPLYTLTGFMSGDLEIDTEGLEKEPEKPDKPLVPDPSDPPPAEPNT